MNKNLENKWLLLDANVIIEQFLHPEEDFWAMFGETMKNLNCKLVITPEIEFEILRGMLSGEDELTLRDFLGKTGISPLSQPQKIWEKALRIGQIYSLHQCRDIDAIDCVLATYAQIYSKNLYLATFNNKHFPNKLFDIESMMNFVIEEEIKVLGIYRFSEEKWKVLEENYSRSKAKKHAK